MNTSDTIVALSTPRGRGGLGVIRLSGPGSLKIAAELFKPSDKQSCEFRSHCIRHGWIVASGRPIDEVMLSYMRAPNSYTGDDVVEISAHGGPVVIDEIISACSAAGARPAAAGEFTFRAFLNGKMDLAEAEAVADLISSKTVLAADAALDQLRGGLSARISAWRGDILDLLAKIEVKLDHAEEDIEFISKEELSTRITALIRALEGIIATFDKGKLLRQGLKTVITGRPNSGKSSLMNALLECERAIVTDLPGTTRDLLEETLDINGLPVTITDTAGLGAAEGTGDAAEKIGRDRAAGCLADSDLVLWLVDSSAPVSENDGAVFFLLESLAAKNRTFVLLSKSDLKPVTTIEGIKNLFPGCASYATVSSASGSGLKELEKAVLDFSGIKTAASGEPVLANERHQAAFASALVALKEASGSIGQSEEITSLHLRESLNTLGEITGETTAGDILDNIFSKFCVGK